MQSIQSADPKPGTAIFVTFKNHVWAAGIVKRPVEEVLKEVQEANRKNETLMYVVPR